MRRALDLHGMKTGPALSKVRELVKIEWCLTSLRVTEQTLRSSQEERTALREL